MLSVWPLRGMLLSVPSVHTFSIAYTGYRGSRGRQHFSKKMTDFIARGLRRGRRQIVTARRVCVARTMPWEDVCLSVRHTPVFCRNGCTYRQLFFSFSTFSIPNGMVILRREPPNWGVECKGYEKVAIFDQYLALSLKRYKIGP